MPFMMDFWHWWVLAFALIVIEMVLPSFFALWLSISAAFTGVILFLFPDLSWQNQVIIFSILSIVSILFWLFYYKKRPIETDEPLLNRRGQQYVGREVTLKEPIVDGFGKVQLDDSFWKIEGEDCAVGTKVKIVGVNNVVFKVEILS